MLINDPKYQTINWNKINNNHNNISKDNFYKITYKYKNRTQEYTNFDKYNLKSAIYAYRLLKNRYNIVRFYNVSVNQIEFNEDQIPLIV